MFKFLKDKLKSAVSKFSKDVEEEVEDVIEESPVEESTEEVISEEKVEESLKEEVSEVVPKEVETIEKNRDEEELASKEPKEEIPEGKEAQKQPKTVKEEKTVEEIKKTPVPNVEQPETVGGGKTVEEPLKEPEKPVSEELKEKIVAPEKPVEKAEEKGFFAKIKDKFTHTKEEKIIDFPPALEPKNSVEEPKEEIIPEEMHKEQSSLASKESAEPAPEKVKNPEPVQDVKVEETKTKITTEKKVEEPSTEEPKENDKKGFFSFISDKITKKSLNNAKFEELFFELEVALLENNVAYQVIEKIKSDMKEHLVGKPLPRGEIENIIIDSLKGSIETLFSKEGFDLLKKGGEKKPYVVCFLGINGSGKTTSIAKVAHILLANKKSVVLAAADTFRAAAIDQLQIHADKLGVKIIKHDYGADAAAVAYDAVKHAEAKNADFVLIDTAGRMHSNVNLQDELKKIVRVAKPDLKIFVGEAITGNDCVEQAEKFNEIVGIDAIILTKADVDEKGGAFVSVGYVTGKPIAFIGMGQEYKDLIPFDKEIVMKNLGLA